jgi:hypothetical protein
VTWILLAQDLIEWQACANRVVKVNITHKAENYEYVSGSTWQINALAAQRLRIMKEAIYGKATSHRKNIWKWSFTYMSVYSNIHTNVLPVERNLREILTFRTLVGFPSDDAVLHTVVSERRLVYVIGKVVLWIADRRIDNISFERFWMRGINGMCCTIIIKMFRMSWPDYNSSIQNVALPVAWPRSLDQYSWHDIAYHPKTVVNT